MSCKNTVVPFSDRIDATFKGGSANNAFSPKMPLTAITLDGDLQILVPASPEKEGCQHSKVLIGRVSERH